MKLRYLLLAVFMLVALSACSQKSPKADLETKKEVNATEKTVVKKKPLSHFERKELKKRDPKYQEINSLIKQYDIVIVSFDYLLDAIGVGTRSGRKVLLLDTRSKDVYDKHTIPSSLHININNFNAALKSIKKNPLKKEIVIFGNDWESRNSVEFAKRLKNYGFINVKLYQEGFEEWKKRYYDEIGTSVVKDLVKNNGAFLIDARPHKKFRGFSLPGSISIPDTKFHKLKGRMPVDKATPIVVFCGGYGCAKSHIVAKQLIGDGYTNVSVYAAGVPAWKKAVGAKKKTPKQTNKINNGFYGPIKKGQDVGTVDGDWFIKNYKKLPKTVAIVDVRKKAERKSGFIKGSKHVSVEENKIDSFIKKLPKNKYIVFYCGAGARSMEARDALIEKKFKNAHKIFYLDASVKCKKRNCTITPNEPLDPVKW